MKTLIFLVIIAIASCSKKNGNCEKWEFTFFDTYRPTFVQPIRQDNICDPLELKNGHEGRMTQIGSDQGFPIYIVLIREL